MTVSAAPRFSLRVPEEWFQFDVWRATRTSDLARLVDRRVQEAPELRPHRGPVLRALRQLADEAERSGALYCAAATDATRPDDALLASLLVLSTGGLPSPALNTVDAVAAQIRSQPATGPDSDWREVHVVELPAGRAVRVRSLTTDDGTRDSSPPGVTMQTLIPVPGSDDILNVVLTSPHGELAPQLLDLFEAISGTLAWEEGPPTR